MAWQLWIDGKLHGEYRFEVQARTAAFRWFGGYHETACEQFRASVRIVRV